MVSLFIFDRLRNAV